MKVVVAGATGFIGRHVCRALRAAGHEVLGGTRQPARAVGGAWVRLDVQDAGSLREAFKGADAIVYLVHHMREHGDALLAAEEASARRVLAAAELAGVKRLVYVGGPEGPTLSDHLRARLRTGEVLRSGGVATIELRCGMVVGHGSESWLIVRDLALRLPAMVLPRWLQNRSQPICIDDVVAAVVDAVDRSTEVAGWFDLPGPDTLTAEQILMRISALAGFRPVAARVPVLTPSLSSHWIRLVTRADYDVARQLVDGLTCDLVAPDDGYYLIAPGLPRTPFDEAARAALAAESPEELSRLARLWEAAARRVGRRA